MKLTIFCQKNGARDWTLKIKMGVVRYEMPDLISRKACLNMARKFLNSEASPFKLQMEKKL